MTNVLRACIFMAVLGCVPAFAIDGVVLINQASVVASGGFPVKITQTGSYKLSGNLMVPAETNGIEISAIGVNLDLNGFSITGPIICDLTGSNCGPIPNALTRGIFASNFIGAVIRNGSVSGFTRGVAGGELIEEILTFSNSSFGILTEFAVVRRNSASRNGSAGIQCTSCTVTENAANNNGSVGLSLQKGVYGSNTLDGNRFGAIRVRWATFLARQQLLRWQWLLTIQLLLRLRLTEGMSAVEGENRRSVTTTNAVCPAP